MKHAFKPDTYNSASPYFIINGAQRLIDLLDAIFGIEVFRKYTREDQSIMHAEVRLDDSILMIGDSGESFTPNTYWMHVYVPDVQHTYVKALEAGCLPVEEPKQREGDSDVRGTFRDFAGNNWSIATQR
nr:VOC family protein [Cytophagales bacterium]